MSASGLALALAPVLSAQAETMPAPRRRYAIVGLGSRFAFFRKAILETYKKHAELVALCDINAGRLNLARRMVQGLHGIKIPGYIAGDFKKMLQETSPDIVIILTTDAFHDEYIVGAMEAGCDVITEKPMTTTAEKINRILEAKSKTGREIRVTFNYRYAPARTQLKELVMSGEIGDVLSVDFNWMLNTMHGADYFRRWHSEKKYSGGLLVHKATHHFDLVNWWLGAVPETLVGASGQRRFYTPEMAARMGLQKNHTRCRTCTEREKCAFALDLEALPFLKSLYLDNEHHDNYYRDRCVFRADIDIEDTMGLVVKYSNGTLLTYSLNAYCAWEGYAIAFNGTKGRIEHGFGSPPGGIASRNEIYTRVIPLRGQSREIDIAPARSAHGGGDAYMLDDIFLPEPADDKFLRYSDESGAIAALLPGIAANRVFGGQATLPVSLKRLIRDMPAPSYANMTEPAAPVPMPPFPTKKPTNK